MERTALTLGSSCAPHFPSRRCSPWAFSTNSCICQFLFLSTRMLLFPSFLSFLLLTLPLLLPAPPPPLTLFPLPSPLPTFSPASFPAFFLFPPLLLHHPPPPPLFFLVLEASGIMKVNYAWRLVRIPAPTAAVTGVAVSSRIRPFSANASLRVVRCSRCMSRALPDTHTHTDSCTHPNALDAKKNPLIFRAPVR